MVNFVISKRPSFSIQTPVHAWQRPKRLVQALTAGAEMRRTRAQLMSDNLRATNTARFPLAAVHSQHLLKRTACAVHPGVAHNSGA